ncbi:MAG: hypothetical protein ACJ75B_03645 [Flavisolibacter sp.]
MKTLFVGVSLFVVSAFANHQKPAQKTMDGYSVTLASTQQVGTNYEWVWSVYNPDPGSGKDGISLQDLSHWNLVLPSCMTQGDLVSAAYSLDGQTWHSLSATIAVDPSQSCYTQPVMKFDQGLDGAQVTYFKLVVNKPFSVGNMPAVFKSGKTLPCYIGTVQGLSCDSGEIRE